VHAVNVLFEIVKAWPNFLPIPAILGGTLIRIGQSSNTMDALFVAIEVVNSGEAFATSATVADIAFVRLIMP
jgi:hypothetical protein